MYYTFLRDAAIVDENDIWVVGLIHLADPDSSFDGTGKKTYNAARWDGERWNLMGLSHTYLYLYSIKYFSANDIWASSHCYPMHWDGVTWTQYYYDEQGYPNTCAGEGIWGISSDNVNFVGDDGCVMHYDGSQFSEITRDATVPLSGIEGTTDGNSFFCAGYSVFGENAGQSVAIAVTGLTANILYEGQDYFSEPYGIISDVAVLGDDALFSTSKGIWTYHSLTGESELLSREAIGWNQLGIHNIEAQARNDIIVISNEGVLNHFNGVSWHNDESLVSLVPGDGSFSTINATMKGDEIVIVGINNNDASGIIIRGHRN